MSPRLAMASGWPSTTHSKRSTRRWIRGPRISSNMPHHWVASRIFSQGEEGHRELARHDARVDQLATDIRTKVADIESSFAQGRWVELIGKQVEKHVGAFSLLAGQASTVNQNVEGQGWVIKEFKDEAKEVKDVLIVAVGDIQAFGSAELFRNQSRATQPVSPDRQPGHPGNAAPPVADPYSIHTPHGQSPVTSSLHLRGRPNTQESEAQESQDEEPWDPWRNAARASAPVQRGSSEQGFKKTTATNAPKTLLGCSLTSMIERREEPSGD